MVTTSVASGRACRWFSGLTLAFFACNGTASTPDPATAAAQPKAQEPAAADPHVARAGEDSEDAPVGEATSGARHEERGGTTVPAAGADAQPESVGTTGGPVAGESTGAAPAPAADAGAAPADPKAVLDEVKGSKTSDERALAALTEAESAGAKPRDLARAAYARAEKLFSSPERAKRFYEWAAAKDPKYAEPVFGLAKQAVVVGDVDLARSHLIEVKARGGRKLLAQVEYDPMWEIVKDDSEVKKLFN